MVEFGTSFRLVMLDVSIPYSGISFLECSGVSTSHPSDSSSKRRVTFVMMAVQEALADWQMVVLVLSCELFWNPPCTNFMKP
jgi:hypothetical protein